MEQSSDNLINFNAEFIINTNILPSLAGIGKCHESEISKFHNTNTNSNTNIHVIKFWISTKMVVIDIEIESTATNFCSNIINLSIQT